MSGTDRPKDDGINLPTGVPADDTSLTLLQVRAAFDGLKKLNEAMKRIEAAETDGGDPDLDQAPAKPMPSEPCGPKSAS